MINTMYQKPPHMYATTDMTMTLELCIVSTSRCSGCVVTHKVDGTEVKCLLKSSQIRVREVLQDEYVCGNVQNWCVCVYVCACLCVHTSYIIYTCSAHTWYCIGMLWLKNVTSAKLHAAIAKRSYVQLEFAPPSRPPRSLKGTISCTTQNGSLLRLHCKEL